MGGYKGRGLWGKRGIEGQRERRGEEREGKGERDRKLPPQKNCKGRGEERRSACLGRKGGLGVGGASLNPLRDKGTGREGQQNYNTVLLSKAYLLLVLWGRL